MNTRLLCKRAKKDNSLESTSFEILPKKDRQLVPIANSAFKIICVTYQDHTIKG